MCGGKESVWKDGERNRPLGVYRPCPCGVCSQGRQGVGYLSFSDDKGRGITIWIEDEKVFRKLASRFRLMRSEAVVQRPITSTGKIPDLQVSHE